jgi:flagellar basal body-associated protein FliL
MNKKIFIIIAIIILAILVGGYIWWKYYRVAPSVPKAEEPAGLGGQIYEQVQNPAEKIPETNPFQAKTNPFEEVKTNPFKEVYKNPFGE